MTRRTDEYLATCGGRWRYFTSRAACSIMVVIVLSGHHYHHHLRITAATVPSCVVISVSCGSTRGKVSVHVQRKVLTVHLTITIHFPQLRVQVLAVLVWVLAVRHSGSCQYTYISTSQNSPLRASERTTPRSAQASPHRRACAWRWAKNTKQQLGSRDSDESRVCHLLLLAEDEVLYHCFPMGRGGGKGILGSWSTRWLNWPGCMTTSPDFTVTPSRQLPTDTRMRNRDRRSEHLVVAHYSFHLWRSWSVGRWRGIEIESRSESKSARARARNEGRVWDGMRTSGEMRLRWEGSFGWHTRSLYREGKMYRQQSNNSMTLLRLLLQILAVLDLLPLLQHMREKNVRPCSKRKLFRNT